MRSRTRWIVGAGAAVGLVLGAVGVGIAASADDDTPLVGGDLD